jgi:CubicO group peptidase (beta-lactamase class C family)
MLLQARSGIYHPALYETPGMTARRPPRFSHAPGSFWYYNNWDFNALGAIYERATHGSIFDALAGQIAGPIGMQDYRPQDGTYVRGPASDIPAYPMRMSARDLARFALLYLNNGAWHGQQIVPAAWVRDSTTAWSTSRAGEGYGYLWWLPRPGVLPPRSFFAWGAGGQYAFVIPEHDLVVVSRVDRDRHLPEPRLAAILDLVAKIVAAGPFAVH